ncbi:MULTISPECIES: hypothetical protein [unclassified Streptomyces]|uniref:hypothetical protein n=1 Tax=unclassified Streptomyces TaxID=2593676 RepID=UPI0037FCE8DF
MTVTAGASLCHLDAGNANGAASLSTGLTGETGPTGIAYPLIGVTGETGLTGSADCHPGV